MRRLFFALVFLFLVASCNKDQKAPLASERDSAVSDAAVNKKDASTKIDASTRPGDADASSDARADGDSSDGQTAATDAGATSDSSQKGDSGQDTDSGQNFAEVPLTWSCRAQYQGDGVTCDCGCTVADTDCHGGGCTQPGCWAADCDACFSESGVEVACYGPNEWTCEAADKGDGECDCGCGDYDPDCGDNKGCSAPGCVTADCDKCHSSSGNEVSCQTNRWICAASVEGTLDGCDCGCGLADPDCKGSGCIEPGCDAPACGRCHDQHGRVTPCSGWICAPLAYADGKYCDCGCGRIDPDCQGKGCVESPCTDDSACDYCHDDKGNSTPCTAWTCNATAFWDDACTCGCGGLDPMCGRLDPGCTKPGCHSSKSCQMCADGTNTINCDWSCDPSSWYDGTCDCGCGAGDLDCGWHLGCVEPGCLAAGCQRCQDVSGHSSSCGV